MHTVKIFTKLKPACGFICCPGVPVTLLGLGLLTTDYTAPDSLGHTSFS